MRLHCGRLLRTLEKYKIRFANRPCFSYVVFSPIRPKGRGGGSLLSLSVLQDGAAVVKFMQFLKQPGLYLQCTALLLPPSSVTPFTLSVPFNQPPLQCSHRFIPAGRSLQPALSSSPPPLDRNSCPTRNSSSLWRANPSSEQSLWVSDCCGCCCCYRRGLWLQTGVWERRRQSECVGRLWGAERGGGRVRCVFRKKLKKLKLGSSASEVAARGPSPAAPVPKSPRPGIPAQIPLWAAEARAVLFALSEPLTGRYDLRKGWADKERAESSSPSPRLSRAAYSFAQSCRSAASPNLASRLLPQHYHPLPRLLPLLFICNANHSYSLVLVLIGLKR